MLPNIRRRECCAACAQTPESGLTWAKVPFYGRTTGRVRPGIDAHCVSNDHLSGVSAEMFIRIGCQERRPTSLSICASLLSRTREHVWRKEKPPHEKLILSVKMVFLSFCLRRMCRYEKDAIFHRHLGQRRLTTSCPRSRPQQFCPGPTF